MAEGVGGAEIGRGVREEQGEEGRGEGGGKKETRKQGEEKLGVVVWGMGAHGGWVWGGQSRKGR